MTSRALTVVLLALSVALAVAFETIQTFDSNIFPAQPATHTTNNVFATAAYPTFDNSAIHPREINWLNMTGLFHNRPIAVSGNPNHLEVHCSGAGNILYRKIRSSSGWGEWEITESMYFSYRMPSVIAHPNGDIDRFSVWRFYFLVGQGMKDGNYLAWEDLKFLVSEVPCPLLLPNGVLSVVVRGPDNRLWETERSGTTWTQWKPMGSATFRSKPTGVTTTGGTAYIFALNSRSVVEMAVKHPGGKWGPLRSIGKVSTCDAQVAPRGDGFVIGICNPSGAVEIAVHSRQGMSQWFNIGGYPSQLPAVVAKPNGHIYVIIRDSNNNLRVASHKSRWAHWSNISGVPRVGSAPTAVARGDTIELFVLAENGSLMHIDLV